MLCSDDLWAGRRACMLNKMDSVQRKTTLIMNYTSSKHKKEGLYQIQPLLLSCLNSGVPGLKCYHQKQLLFSRIFYYW